MKADDRKYFVVTVQSKKLHPKTKKPLRWSYILSDAAASECFAHWRTRPGIVSVVKRPYEPKRAGAVVEIRPTRRTRRAK